MNLWANAAHALEYLQRADSISHRVEGESTLLEFIPAGARRVLDLGSGDGRLLALVRIERADAAGVALDFSPLMIEKLHARFAGDPLITVIQHDLDRPLPRMAPFDAVVSSFAIHHLSDERKRAVYGEVFDLLAIGGVFCNLEHVSSPTAHLHEEFFRMLGSTAADEDPSNQLLDVETQLSWMREIGFADVDCHWKWRELALLAGTKRHA